MKRIGLVVGIPVVLVVGPKGRRESIEKRENEWMSRLVNPFEFTVYVIEQISYRHLCTIEPVSELRDGC